MNRYLTIQDYDNNVQVFTESSNKTDIAEAMETMADYVWQYAPDANTAIAQHDAKHDEYMENPEKDTY